MIYSIRSYPKIGPSKKIPNRLLPSQYVCKKTTSLITCRLKIAKIVFISRMSGPVLSLIRIHSTDLCRKSLRLHVLPFFFSSAKFGKRALAQAMARELGPKARSHNPCLPLLNNFMIVKVLRSKYCEEESKNLYLEAYNTVRILVAIPSTSIKNGVCSNFLKFFYRKFGLFMYFVQQSLICPRPDSTVSQHAGIESRTVAQSE
jgi:hypothetical protein